MKDDTISRAAAIDAFLTELTKRERKNFLHTWSTVEVKYFVADMLEKLPSAQPSATDTNVGGTDCISREAAIAEFSSCELTPDGGIDANYAIDFLKQMPSAQSEPKSYRMGYQAGYAAAQRWIPCSERMPKPNEEDGNGFYKAYLVQDGRWMDVARWDGKYWVAWGYSTVLLNVVAWMPLPTPYREGGQDETEQ